MPDTPDLLLPYPAASDPVAGGAAAIQDLAENIDELFGPWVDFAGVVGGFTEGNGDQGHRYRIDGPMMELWGYLVLGSTSAVTGALALPMPAGFITDSWPAFPSFTAGTLMPVGNAMGYDDSVGERNTGVVLTTPNGTNTLQIRRSATGEGAWGLADAPWGVPWDTDDWLTWCARFPVA